MKVAGGACARRREENLVEPLDGTHGEWPARRRCKMSYARALEAAGITKPLEHCIRQPLVTLSKVSIT